MSRNRSNVQLNQAKDVVEKVKMAKNMPTNLAGAFEKLEEIAEEDKLKFGVDKRDLPSKSLKSIALTGFAESVVDIAGHKFKIATLSSRDRRKFVSLLMKVPEEQKILALKTYTLSVAIKEIDGKSLEEHFDETFGEEELSDDDKRIEFLDSLSAQVIDFAYDEYDKLTREANEELSSERLENKIKN